MGFISAVYESNIDLYDNDRLVWLLTSFSFVSVLALENVLMQPRKYSPLLQKEMSLNESDSVDQSDNNNDIEMTNKENQNLSEDINVDQLSEEEIVSDDILIKMKRATLSVIIVILSFYGFIRGLATTHHNFDLLINHRCGIF